MCMACINATEREEMRKRLKKGVDKEETPW